MKAFILFEYDLTPHLTIVVSYDQHAQISMFLRNNLDKIRKDIDEALMELNFITFEEEYARTSNISLNKSDA